jgi:tetratricopeptide (TPR) repeat protein
MEELDFSKLERGRTQSKWGKAVLRILLLILLGAALFLGIRYGSELLETRRREDLAKQVDAPTVHDIEPDKPEIVVEQKPVAELLAEAEVQLRLGIPTEAVNLAKKALVLAPEEPATRLLLGHALLLSGKRAEAMDEYQQALAAKPDYIRDDRLWTYLEDALKSEVTAEKAATMLARFGGEKGISLLRDRANSPLADRTERSTARSALIAVERVEAVDWLATLSADFNDFKACKKRRQIIIQMEETKDPRFISLLEAQRPWNKANACIKNDAERAITELGRIAAKTTGSSDTASTEGAP